MRRSRAIAAVAASLALVLVSGCSASVPPDLTGPSVTAPTAAPSVSSAPVEITGDPEPVAEGLAAPWSIAFLADGTALVSERDSGRILEVGDDATREVGVVGGVVHGGEGGLLGLAVDADDRLFVYSTGERGNRIQRFELDGESGGLALGEALTILDGIPSGRNHNGGRLAFGPDGMLYATAGDAGDPARAQDLETLAGKILRMTPDGDAPTDNPYESSLVYSWGHRNPQGIAWADDGTMFASEFGQNTWDELNIIVPGGNYGWPAVEGTGGVERGFIDPVHQWATDEASPSGIAIAGGTVFVAGLRGEVLHAVEVAEPAASTALFAGDHGRLRDAATAPDGTLWVLTNNTDGRGTPGEGDDRILSFPLG